MREIKIVRLLLIILATLVLFLGYKYYASFNKTPVIQISRSQIDSANNAKAKENSNPSSALIKINNDATEPAPQNNFSKQQLEEIIRDYIMSNPQVIIDSTVALQNKKQKEELDNANNLVAQKKAELEDIEFYPYIGPKNASSKIIMFYDYNCNYCKTANVVLNQAIAENSNIQVIYRPLPILGSDSNHLAKVMLTVFQIAPEKFKLIHDELMSIDNIKLADFDKILSNNNINVDENKALKENLELLKESLAKSDNAIKSTLTLAKSINMRGVPAFIIHEKLYPGMMSLSQMKGALEQNIINVNDDIKDKPVENKAQESL